MRRPNGLDQAALHLAFPGKWVQWLPVVPTPKLVPGLYLAAGCPPLVQGYGGVVAGQLTFWQPPTEEV